SLWSETMNIRLTTSTLGLIACTSLFAVSQAALAHQCRLAETAGDYGYTSQGTIVTPAVGPFTTVGRVTFTDAGTFSGAQTTSIAGTFEDETVDGTYTVNPDCTGSASVSVYVGGVLVRSTTLHMVWDLGATEIRALFLTDGTNISIDARKIFLGR